MFDFFKPDFQFFADGGDGSGATGDSGNQGAADLEQGKQPVLRTKRGTPIYAQEQPAQEPVQPEADADNKPTEDTYESLVRGKNARFREEYEQDVSKIVQDRLKSAKGAEDNLKKLAPLLDELGRRYGVDASDIGKLDVDNLMELFVGDPAHNEDGAIESGRTPEEEGAYQVLQMRSRQLEQLKQESAQEMVQRQRFEALARESAALKQKYPDFDIRAEMGNHQFVRMFDAGVPLENAYIALHSDAVMAQTAQQAKAQVTASIQAGARRPRENSSGLNASSALAPNFKDPAVRADIRARVRRGEKVTFDP